jgi:tRNA pseudouridine55 synthase
MAAQKPDLRVDTMSDNVHSDHTAQKDARETPYLHPRQILTRLPSVTSSPQVIAAIRNGRSVNLPEFSDAPLVKVFANQELLVAIMHRIAGTLFEPSVVLFGGNEPLPL